MRRAYSDLYTRSLEAEQESRRQGKVPCMHYTAGFKHLSPDICPWCKVAVLQQRILELENVEEKYNEELQELMTKVIRKNEQEDEESFTAGYEWGWIDGRSRVCK